MLEKHILSNYSQIVPLNNSYNSNATGLTEAVENSDADEFREINSTSETRNVENSDADDFC